MQFTIMLDLKPRIMAVYEPVNIWQQDQQNKRGEWNSFFCTFKKGMMARNSYSFQIST